MNSLSEPERPKEYVKGPDVMSKLKRTQHQYQEANHGQQRLDTFAFTPKPKPVDTIKTLAKAEITSAESESMTIRQESVEIEIPPAIREESVEAMIPPNPNENIVNKESGEGWEDDLDECVHGGSEIHGWDVL